MTAPSPSRPWWKRKRWIAAGVLWLAVGYPLSGGPSAYCVVRGWCPLTLHGIVYAPLGLAALTFPAVREMSEDYGRWWIRLAERHAASE